MNRTHLFFTKHNHMMKNGAPPDSFRVLYRLLPLEFHGFTSRTDITLCFLVLSQFSKVVLVPLMLPACNSQVSYSYHRESFSQLSYGNFTNGPILSLKNELIQGNKV